MLQHISRRFAHKLMRACLDINPSHRGANVPHWISSDRIAYCNFVQYNCCLLYKHHATKRRRRNADDASNDAAANDTDTDDDDDRDDNNVVDDDVCLISSPRV